MPSRSYRQAFVQIWPWLVLCIALGITFLLWWQQTEAVAQRAKGLFDDEIRRVRLLLDNRLQFYDNFLIGGRSFETVSDEITSDKWTQYVKLITSDSRALGIINFGILRDIDGTATIEHQTATTELAVSDVLFSPFVQDLLQQPLRFEKATLSPIITVAQTEGGLIAPPTSEHQHSHSHDDHDHGSDALGIHDDDNPVVLTEQLNQTFVVMLLPLVPSDDKMSGWIYAVLQPQALLSGSIGDGDHGVHIDVFDGTQRDPDSLLYTHSLDAHEHATAIFVEDTEFVFNTHDRQWLIYFATTARFAELIDSNRPALFLGGGLFTSLLAFTVSWLLANSRNRAVSLAREMTDDLENSQARLRLVLENVPLVIFSFDQDGVLTFVEGKALNQMNLQRETLAGRSIFEVFEDKPELVVGAKAALAGSVSSFSVTFNHLFWELWFTPIVHNHRVDTVVGVAVDVTTQQRLEQFRREKEDAEAASRAKSEFLANMSHEIRTPLNAVIGMTSLLGDTELNDALLSLLNDILDFSKIEAGKLELEEFTFRLRDAVEDALDLVAPRASEKKLELTAYIAPGTPTAIVGDLSRLRQVLVNLLSNAVKFTHQGEVSVSVSAQSLLEKGIHRLHFKVRDTGIGIPQQRMDRLFQSFSQVDSSTTRQYGGTGLGLIISKRLTEMMGGEIWVESKIGSGSTFQFTIMVPESEEPLPPIIDPSLVDLNGKNLLIVDDNETNRQILKMQTEQWGLIAHTVHSGAMALDALNEHPDRYDIAILDMQMPQMDGLELAAEIQNRWSPEDLPLLMLTSLGYRTDVTTSKKVQFAAFLTKPVREGQLYEAIIDAFGSHYQHRINKLQSPEFNVTLSEQHPLTILLVEDNAVNQQVATLVLDRFGYQTDVAGNGLEALDALKRQRYDVVLMDIQMPEMDGMTATTEIRKTVPAQEQPYIIAVTANALPGDREKYLGLGMNDYLSKPLRPHQLRTALQKAYRQHIGHSVEATASSADPVAPPPETEPMMAFDVSQLHEMIGDDPELVTDMLQIYLEDAPNYLTQLDDAFAQNDIETFTRTAHTLKSTNRTVGAMLFGEKCYELEQMGKRGDLSAAPAMMAELPRFFQETKEAIEMYIFQLAQG